MKENLSETVIVECPACNGEGWTVEAVCCGRPNREGCCLCPTPEQVECETCAGRGTIEVPKGKNVGKVTGIT